MMFHVRVAATTEANEIRECVCVLGPGECTNGPDVVHIGRAAWFRATTAARVEVAQAGSPSCFAPVRSVVGRMASLPRGIVLAASVSVAARKRAERHAALAFTTPAWVLEDCLAVEARERSKDAPPFRFFRGPQHRGLGCGGVHVWLGDDAPRDASRSTGVVAFSRAVGRAVPRLDLRWRPPEGFPAARTCEVKAIPLLLASHDVRTRARACRLSAPAEPLGIRQVRGAAPGAHSRNYVVDHVDGLPPTKRRARS